MVVVPQQLEVDEVDRGAPRKVKVPIEMSKIRETEAMKVAVEVVLPPDLLIAVPASSRFVIYGYGFEQHSRSRNSTLWNLLTASRQAPEHERKQEARELEYDPRPGGEGDQ